MGPRWYTKSEIARELRVSVRTVERLHLPHMRVGGQNRYSLEECEAHLRGERRRAEIVELRPRRGVAA